MIKNLLKTVPSRILPYNFSIQFCQSDKKPVNEHEHEPNKKGLVYKNGVYIDEERIKAKMQQIKLRSKQKKTQHPELLKNYKINKQNQQTLKFRKDTDTQNLMNIQDVSLDLKPTQLNVTGYTHNQIKVDHFQYPPSLILTPYQMFVWQISSIKYTTPESYKIIQIMNPPPEYVLIGCEDPKDVPESVHQYLRELGVFYQTAAMFQAVSNFNMCSLDRINFIAFLNSTVDTQTVIK